MRKHDTSPCKVLACQNMAWARQMCRKHYYRWRQHGDPQKVLTTVPKRGEIQRWLLEHANVTDEQCLIWPFTTNGVGYGLVSLNGKRHLVSRVMCERRHGLPPSPVHQAAHKCGNGHGGCVNPSHLEWKTPKENQADIHKHGTACCGEQNPLSKLTVEQVKAIRTNLHSSKIASRQFGVSEGYINEIKRGRKWKHI